jgi:hypothetical protein
MRTLIVVFGCGDDEDDAWVLGAIVTETAGMRNTAKKQVL